MKNYLVITLLLFSLQGFGQITELIVGVDFGTRKGFDNISLNEGNYLRHAQKDWIGRKFFIGDFYISSNAEIRFRNNIQLGIGASLFNITEYIKYYIPELMQGGGGSFFVPSVKLFARFGRSFSLGNDWEYLPMLQLSYVPSDRDLTNSIPEGGIDTGEDFTIISRDFYLSNTNVFVGLLNKFQWKFNDRLILHVAFGYDQGLFRHSRTEFLLRIGETEKRATSFTRLSHSQLSLGAQFRIWKK